MMGTPPPARPAWRAGRVAGCLVGLRGLLAADVRHLHFRRAAGRTGAQLGVAVGADCPDGCDLLAQRLSLAPPRSTARRSLRRQLSAARAPERPSACAQIGLICRLPAS